MGTKEETDIVTDPTKGPEEKSHVQLVNLGEKKMSESVWFLFCTQQTDKAAPWELSEDFWNMPSWGGYAEIQL